jgi:hypothetical protein
METEHTNARPGRKLWGAISLALTLAGTALVGMAAWALQGPTGKSSSLACLAGGLACQVAAVVAGDRGRRTPTGRAGRVIAVVVMVLTFLGGLYRFIVSIAAADASL